MQNFSTISLNLSFPPKPICNFFNPSKPFSHFAFHLQIHLHSNFLLYEIASVQCPRLKIASCIECLEIASCILKAYNCTFCRLEMGLGLLSEILEHNTLNWFYELDLLQDFHAGSVGCVVFCSEV